MFEAHQIAAWDHTAATLATVVGLVDRSARVEKFHPYRKSARRPGVRLTADVLLSLKKRFSP